MSIIVVVRTVSERVRIDSAELADLLGIDEDTLLHTTPNEIAAYIVDYCQDGDDAIYAGAKVSDENVIVQITG